MPLSLRVALGVLGAVIYAAAGVVIGSQNSGWFRLGRNSNDVLPALGVGAGLVVIAFVGSRLCERVHRSGAAGVAGEVLLVLGPVLYVVSALIDFAIFGTFSFGFGLVCLAVAVIRNKLVPVADRVLIALSAVGSLTWNTETTSAFLLTGVGLIWVVLTFRLLSTETRERTEH